MVKIFGTVHFVHVQYLVPLAFGLKHVLVDLASFSKKRYHRVGVTRKGLLHLAINGRAIAPSH
eukprot:SAG11_NODE_1534_length_4732_cov_1.778545_5_plen_63_part_00